MSDARGLHGPRQASLDAPGLHGPDSTCPTHGGSTGPYGRASAREGSTLKIIQELMGHATNAMTIRYAHLSPEARERAVQELDRPIPQSCAALG